MATFNLVIWRYVSRRRQSLLFILATTLVLVLLSKAWWLASITSSALLPPPPLRHDLTHFRKNRHLKPYLYSIELFIEPSSTPCEGVEGVPLLVLVTSSPGHVWQRMAVRGTWGKRLPTYFVIGLDQTDNDDQLSDIYMEAKQYSDMVVYDLVENYQNLTLKSALLLYWAHRRCPQAETVLKTDDDVLVNPWTMLKVVKEHVDHQLIGYKKNDSAVHRDEYSKWFMPRWLYPDEVIPEYLSGTGYLINGEYIDRILKGANKVPLVNLEDVYFTYLVAKTNVGLTLTHDPRLSPFKPWIRASCSLWGQASVHSLNPEEMVAAWTRLLPLGKDFEGGKTVCDGFSFLSSEFFLY